MADEDLALVLKYPLISSEVSAEKTQFWGSISVRNEDCKLHVIVEDSNNFKVLTRFGTSVDERIAKIKSSNIVEFLNKVTATLEGCMSTCLPINRVHVYRKVLHEYSEFVRFHIKLKNSKISANLTKIEATTLDERGREHYLEIAVDFDEVDIYRPIRINLPDQFSKDFEKNFANLTDLYSKFLITIDSLQPFFDSLDDLDRICCVIDPEKPSRRDCYRRIWLNLNLSMVVLLDPLNVKARPDLKFLGPERLILEYREKLNQKLENWDDSSDVIEGLLSILDIETFPMKPTSNRDMLMETGECSICFSLRCNNKLPEIICGNKSCENYYHVDCLYEWLTSVNSKRAFNQIRGQCPNCEKGISCPLPDVVMP